MSTDHFDTHTVTLSSTGRDTTFTLAELYELRDRSHDLINEAETNRRTAQSAQLDPTRHGWVKITAHQGRTRIGFRHLDYYYDPNGYGLYPYGVPLIAFGPLPTVWPTHSRVARANQPQNNKWFITLSGNPQLTFGEVDWDDEAGLQHLMARIASTPAEAFATQAALSDNIRWDDRQECPWDDIDNLLDLIPQHEAVDALAVHNTLDAQGFTVGGVQLLDPYTMRFVELPQLIGIEVPYGTTVARADKAIRAQGLTPLRSTGKRPGYIGIPQLRLAAHKNLAKHIPSLPKRLIYWMYGTRYNADTGQWERAVYTWDNRPHLNPTSISLQDRTTALDA